MTGNDSSGSVPEQYLFNVKNKNINLKIFKINNKNNN